MPERRREYDSISYRRARRNILSGAPTCWRCGEPATTADHDPPLAYFPDGEWVGDLLPACAPCNFAGGARVAAERRGAATTNRDPPRPAVVSRRTWSRAKA